MVIAPNAGGGTGADWWPSCGMVVERISEGAPPIDASWGAWTSTYVDGAVDSVEIVEYDRESCDTCREAWTCETCRTITGDADAGGDAGGDGEKERERSIGCGGEATPV